MVQMPRRAESCTSVLRPTLCFVQREMIQPLSGSVVPVMIRQPRKEESGTAGSRFMSYTRDYNMFNMYSNSICAY